MVRMVMSPSWSNYYAPSALVHPSIDSPPAHREPLDEAPADDHLGIDVPKMERNHAAAYVCLSSIPAASGEG